MLIEINAGQAIDGVSSYVPVVIQFVVAGGFVATTLLVTHLLGPKLPTKKKLKAFESGVQSVGNARQPFAIKYFLTAILFVLFDVEIIFLYPYAVNFYYLGSQGLITISLFMVLLLIGFFYVYKKGALNWE
jgi:NADH-quinone oxidoreductase subunit A